jgi:hypothetical protein
MHSERIFNRIDPRGLATGLASECNEIKIPYISKIPCGLAAGFFISYTVDPTVRIRVLSSWW